MTGVPSSAAVVHITVSPIVLQKDLVLATLFQAISQLPQVTIQQDKKIPLLYTAEGILLKQRNAIVRALIGTGLHGALDHTSSSSSIATAAAAGGHWSRRHASPTSAMAWASMLYWMTDVKEQIIQQRNKTNSDNNSILERIVSELSEQLKDHAFLVPHTAMPTVADYDVALALATTTTTTLPSNNNNNMTLVDKYPNVMRWMKTTLTSLQQQMQTTSHGGCQDSRSNNTKNPTLLLPALSLPASIVSKYVSSSQSQSQPQSSVPPIFFDGTEDATAILQQLHATAEAAAATASGGSINQQKQKTEVAWKATNKKQQQQQQQQQHAGESKKEKKKKQQQQQQPADAADAAADYDISALDIRVGQIIKIWPHESAEKLYCEDIDLGNGEIRQIASGLRPFYAAPDLLQGQKVLVLMNLKKRNLVGFPSHGMVLCASNADHSKVELVVPPAEAALGQRVWFGSSGSSSTSSDKQKDPEPENKVQKKKLMELLLPDLKTNDQGIVVWKGAEARTSAGVVKAVNGMANAQVA